MTIEEFRRFYGAWRKRQDNLMGALEEMVEEIENTQGHIETADNNNEPTYAEYYRKRRGVLRTYQEMMIDNVMSAIEMYWGAFNNDESI